MCDLHHIRINRLIISLHLVIDYEVMGITEHLNWTKEYWLIDWCYTLFSGLNLYEIYADNVLNCAALGSWMAKGWKASERAKFVTTPICYLAISLPWYECDSSTSISLHFPKLRLPYTQILRVTLTEMLQPLDRMSLGTRLKHSNSF